MKHKWTFKNLSEVCDRISDGLHGTPSYVEGGGYYFVNGNNLKNGHISINQETKTVGQKEFDAHKVALSESTLLLSINGTIGAMALYRGEPIVLGKSAAYINCRDVDRRFCYYYFQLKGVNDAFYNIATGSTIKNLGLESLKNFLLPVPPRHIQEKIAGLLSLIDDKLELNNQINEELEGLAKLLYDYWFVQFDFPITVAQAAAMGKPHLKGKPYRASGGKMIYNKVLKREIPDGWIVTTLSDFSNITMGQSPPGDTYNQTGAGVVFFQGSTDFGWRYPKVREFTTSPSRFAREGDILLSVRAPVGTLNIADQDCCVGRGVAALNSKSGHDSFLFEVMLYFKMIFDRRNSAGTTFGAITKDDLHSLKFACPPMDSPLLDAFEEKTKPGHTAILINHRQNLHLTELRDWLLPMLMNGQVTVC